eukprot:Blabericola_migrator_1__13457@NODE_96_length_14432_cov_203_974173_g86_i0_p6_GENE_NODE_96_length_14432_cov_203_974173_g86_i0NODE_96_length_14432_cov_203_974173_g86_i0_p6_ORF_typecomplete_len330_score56_03UFD1/PF03152_14/5_3e63Fanconi_A/PF03511_14/0_26_NODE_96_length_14432_cov_203_974173_g86_i063727361
MWSSLGNFVNSGFRNGGGMFPGPGPGDHHHEVATFDKYYKCHSASIAGKPELERGNKILLPPSALQMLARMNVSWPMLFELRSGARRTHCGVLEFVAEEDYCNLPYWMMQNLCVDEGQLVRVINTSLPKGTFVKLQPVTSDFLDISNPKAVLENSLRHFAALTVGDCIALSYNDRIYEIEIIECRPADAVSIIETDVDVDFAPPKDYVEPPPAVVPEVSPTGHGPMSDQSSEDEMVTESNFTLFGGSGARLNGDAQMVSPFPVSESPTYGDFDDEPWLRRLPHGVRTFNRRYTELLKRGLIKPWSSTYSAADKNKQGIKLFEGSVNRLE